MPVPFSEYTPFLSTTMIMLFTIAGLCQSTNVIISPIYQNWGNAIQGISLGTSFNQIEVTPNSAVQQFPENVSIVVSLRNSSASAIAYFEGDVHGGLSLKTVDDKGQEHPLAIDFKKYPPDGRGSVNISSMMRIVGAGQSKTIKCLLSQSELDCIGRGNIIITAKVFPVDSNIPVVIKTSPFSIFK